MENQSRSVTSGPLKKHVYFLFISLALAGAEGSQALKVCNHKKDKVWVFEEGWQGQKPILDIR